MGTTTMIITASEAPLPLTGRREELKLLLEPTSPATSLGRANLGYQMQHSAKVLEERLAEEGRPHVLQLNLSWHDDDWQNPHFWHLYADGTEVLQGDGSFARQCFVEDEEAFLSALRRGVEQADLPELSKDEYRLLCRARDIARFEPFDDGSHVLGGRDGRVF